uniref:C-type lectin domain-containing protein n=1 Tax=Oryzias sinensis TaxID=183150 RepID=A0A8C7X2K2_9TELE
MTLGGTRYLSCGVQMTPQDKTAQVVRKVKGILPIHHTDLTSLRNDAEYQTVEGVSKGQDVYVGLSRDPWEWSDQTESSLRFWRPTQTINTAYAEKCVALLSGESGHWRDMDCTVERPFLCSYSEYR